METQVLPRPDGCRQVRRFAFAALLLALSVANRSHADDFPFRFQPPWRCLSAQDQAALSALYNSSGGASWNDSTGWFDSDPASRVKVAGIITPLNDGLTEEPPRPPNITNFGLGQNNLSGTIAPEIGDLTSLTHLSLRANALTGPIPAEIGQLTNLENLNLEENQLSGPLPNEMGSLANLHTLDVANNQFTGAIPASFSGLTALNVIYASSNDLTDITALVNVPDLSSVFIANNRIDITPGSANRDAIDQMIADGVSVEFEPQKADPSLIVVEHEVDEETDDGMLSLREAVKLAVERAAIQPNVPVRVMVPDGDYVLESEIIFEMHGDEIIEIVGDGGLPRISGNGFLLFPYADDDIDQDDENTPKCRVESLTFSSNGGIAIITKYLDLHVQGCQFVDCANPTGPAGGAAIFAELESEVVVTGCDFLNCSAGVAGGAIATRNESVLCIRDCIFENCSSQLGSAIYTSNDDIIEVVESTFTTCSAAQGTIVVDRVSRVPSAANVIDCLFDACAASSGRCAGIDLCGAVDSTIKGCTFKGMEGGAICIRDGSRDADITGCLITGTVRQDDQHIAAIWVEDSVGNTEVRETTIAYNDSSGLVAHGSDMVASHCTIVSNIGEHALGVGSEENWGIGSLNGGTVKVDHCLVAENTIGFSGFQHGNESFGYNLLGANPGSGLLLHVEDLLPAQGGRPGDLGFGRIIGRALSLRPHSPAIDAGSPSFVSGVDQTDGRGAPRVAGGRVDIGAFESDYESLRSILEVFFDEVPTDPVAIAQLLNDDQDGDRSSTMVEIGTGTNAAVFDAPNNPRAEFGSLVLEFELNERLKDFDYCVEYSSDLQNWVPGSTFTPMGSGSGYTRTAGAGSELLSATQDGAIWTIRERIAPGDTPAQMFGRLSFDVDLGGGGGATGTTELIFEGSFNTDYGARVDALTVGNFSYGGEPGFTPNIDAFYGDRTPHRKVASGYGDLTDVLQSNGGLVEIYLVADPGKRIRLERFDMAAEGADFAEDPTIDRVEVLYGDGSAAFSQSDVTISETTHNRFDFGGVPIVGQYLIVRFDSRNLAGNDGSIGIDNVRFSQLDSTEPGGDSTLLTFDIGSSSGSTYGRRVDAARNGSIRHGGAPGFTPNINLARTGSGMTFRSIGYGDLYRVLVGHTLQVTLTADPGYEVRFDRFDLAALDHLFTSDPTIDLIEVADGDGNVLFSQSNVSISETAHTSIDFGGTPLQAAELVFRFDAQNLAAAESPIGLDNVLFGQVEVGVP